MTSSNNDANGYSHNSVPVTLKAGDNTITLFNNIDWGPHWDYIDISDGPAGVAYLITSSVGVGSGTISPDFGYVVSDVSVTENGGTTSKGAISSYTFSNVQADGAPNFGFGDSLTLDAHGVIHCLDSAWVPEKTADGTCLVLPGLPSGCSDRRCEEWPSMAWRLAH